MRRLAPIVPIALLAGCTSISGSSTDAAPADCQAPPDYGAAIATEQHAEAQGDLLELVGALSDTIPDVFSLELYGDAIAPGVFAVGDQYETCEVCAVIYADFIDGSIGSMYLATAGSVTITDVSPRLTGTVSNLAFIHVVLDDDLHSTPAAGGCATSMTSLTFDAEVDR